MNEKKDMLEIICWTMIFILEIIQIYTFQINNTYGLIVNIIIDIAMVINSAIIIEIKCKEKEESKVMKYWDYIISITLCVFELLSIWNIIITIIKLLK